MAKKIETPEELDKLKETYEKIQYFYNTKQETPGSITAKDGDLMIVYDKSKVYLCEYNNKWECKRDAAYSETISAIVGVLEKDTFDQLREQTRLLYYYYTYVLQNNTIFGKYAIVSNKGQLSDLPIPGDKTIILNAVSGNGTLLRAAGVFISKEYIEIEDGTYLFKDLPINLTKGTQSNNQSSKFDKNKFDKNKKIYDTYHKELKSNYEPHNYYYFGLSANDFEYFSTGEAPTNTRQKDTGISGLMQIKKNTFTDCNILPKKGDLALIFEPVGTNNPKYYSRFLGIIDIIEKEIHFNVIRCDEIELGTIKNQEKLKNLNGLANQCTGSHFKPFQVSKHTFEEMLKICFPLLSHHNIVFNGAPGTGKTHTAKQIAKMLDAKTQFVQFHPSYDYTDFVEGLRPIIPHSDSKIPMRFFNKTTLPNQRQIPKFGQGFSSLYSSKYSSNTQNAIGFERKDGVFKAFCKKAVENMLASLGKKIKGGAKFGNDNDILFEEVDKTPLKKFIFIIDEINRGDMSKIFGELFYNIEQSYRVPANLGALTSALQGDSQYAIQTQYQNLIEKDDLFYNGFFIPDNVYIIGTMNDVDRSVESMDFAMRRRFRFIEVTPEEGKGMLYDSLKDKADDAINKMNEINKQIKEKLGDEYQIGPSYFLDLKTNPNIDSVVKQRILPLIKEYCRGDQDLYKELCDSLELPETNSVALKKLHKVLGKCYNIVFNGAPGTGKTYRAKQLAKRLKAETQFVQFHPSYDYTDFVEGLRPIQNVSSIGFERRDGIFKDFCRRAAENLAASKNKIIDWKKGELKDSTQQKNVSSKNFVFIIDEINRGDMSKIFGELFYSIEPNYRVKVADLEKAINGDIPGNDIVAVQTQYQNLIRPEEPFSRGFFIPDNVYIIGTMNDVDRSVESMDFAMRRRFRFIEVTPKKSKCLLYDSLKDKATATNAIKKMDEINEQIKEKLGDEYQIGPSYFLDLKTNPNIDLVVKQRILPLIKEYCRGDNELYKAIEEKILPPEQKEEKNSKKTAKKQQKEQ